METLMYARIENNNVTRSNLPEELLGLNDSSLEDLSWTDPSLGLQHIRFLPISKIFVTPTSTEEMLGVQGELLYDGIRVIENILPVLKPTPLSLTPQQLRRGLTAVGLRTSVESAVASAPQDTKDWYQFATSFERNHPEVLAMAEALGVTPEQLDDLWRLASTL